MPRRASPRRPRVPHRPRSPTSRSGPARSAGVGEVGVGEVGEEGAEGCGTVWSVPAMGRKRGASTHSTRLTEGSKPNWEKFACVLHVCVLKCTTFSVIFLHVQNACNIRCGVWISGYCKDLFPHFCPHRRGSHTEAFRCGDPLFVHTGDPFKRGLNRRRFWAVARCTTSETREGPKTTRNDPTGVPVWGSGAWMYDTPRRYPLVRLFEAGSVQRAARGVRHFCERPVFRCSEERRCGACQVISAAYPWGDETGHGPSQGCSPPWKVRHRRAGGAGRDAGAGEGRRAMKGAEL